MSRNIRNLSLRKGLSDNLFEAVADAANDQSALAEVAEKFLVGKATTYGTATFYDFLNPENAGKKAFTCAGSACLLAGTQGAARQKLEQHFAPEEIGHVYCLGRCYENSAFHCQGKNFSGEAIDQLPEIVGKEDTPASKNYTQKAVGRAILTAQKPDFEDCINSIQYLLNNPPEDLLREIEASGLRGRGGAGFPTAIKLAAVKKEISDKKYIVCNADEGDPGAFSDRYILEERPHLLLLGMVLAGYITGAEEGVVYIRKEYPESIGICRAAIEKFNAHFPFKKSDGTTVRFKLYVIEAQGAYICGEETALLNSIEGMRAEVRTRPPFPVQAGLFGKPTIVNNVETLANLPQICLSGGKSFRAIGTEKSSGTKLLSLDSHFKNPGLYEVEMGTPLSKVIHEIGGGWREPVKGLHIGGPLGGIVPVEKIDSLSVDFESFAAGGFLLGHASVLSIPARFPIIEYLEHLFEFTAHESCGKCFPCRLGSVRGAELLHKSRTQGRRIDRELFADLLDTLEKGSLCGLGGGLPLPVRNVLQYFGEELSAYFSK